MEFLNLSSVELLPNAKASAAFTVDSSKVFKEQQDIPPVVIDEGLSYIPWGADNQMPYEILNLIESDETLSTCQMFNAEVCYGSGLVYNTDKSTTKARSRSMISFSKTILPATILEYARTSNTLRSAFQ